MVNSDEVPREWMWDYEGRFEEDYPGQKDEIRRNKIIDEAVQAADGVILQGSDGSVEETRYLTAMVAQRLVEKVVSDIQAQQLAVDLKKRLPREEGV